MTSQWKWLDTFLLKESKWIYRYEHSLVVLRAQTIIIQNLPIIEQLQNLIREEAEVAEVAHDSVFLFNNRAYFYNSNIQRRGRTFSEGWGTRGLLLGVFYFIFNPTALLGVFRGGACGNLWEGARPQAALATPLCVHILCFLYFIFRLKKIIFLIYIYIYIFFYCNLFL